MSDAMLLGVLRMPWNDQDDLTLIQIKSRMHEAADRIEDDAKRIDQLLQECDALSNQVQSLDLKCAELELSTEKPIPMLIWCPECGERHIDGDEFATKAHHTHACQNCGNCWRPAVVDTVGVQFLPGFKDK